MRFLSLCHGRKKFLVSRLSERLSSSTMMSLLSVLRCHIGICMYHHLRKLFRKVSKISKYEFTLVSLSNC